MVAEDDVTRIVQGADRIAVVGWSRDASRPSNDVASYLHEQGYEILAINPTYAGDAAYGTTVKASLADIDGPVDVLLVFRRSEAVTQHVEEAIEARVPVFWMQLGIRNEQAATRLRQEGIEVVQDRCFKVEHGKRVGA